MEPCPPPPRVPIDQSRPTRRTEDTVSNTPIIGGQEWVRVIITSEHEPFFTLAAPVTAKFLGDHIRMSDASEQGQDVSKNLATQFTTPDASASPKTPAGAVTPPTTGGTLIDASSGDALERVIDDADMDASPPSEVIEALAFAGVTTWKTFLHMDESHIPNVTKPAGRGPLPVSPVARDSMAHLKGLTWENIESKNTSASDPGCCTQNMHDAFVVKALSEKRRGAQQTLATSTGGPSFGTATGNNRPLGEKKCDSWTRSKHTKAGFEILSADKHCIRWKPAFEAELTVQKIAHLTDPAFDENLITCSYEKQPCEEQVACSWTVLLRAFQNPLGKTCISAHMKTEDARQAHFDHEKLQEDSPSKACDTGECLGDLQKLTPSTACGTRVDFIAAWFEQLRLLNEISASDCSCDFTRTVLLRAVSSDDRMADAFSELQPAGNDSADVLAMKTHLLSKASLHDGEDNLSQIPGAERGGQPRRAMQHASDLTSASFDDILANGTPDIIEDIHNHAAFRASRSGFNPSARLRDDIHGSMDSPEKQAWRNLPESVRVKIVQGYDAPPKGAPFPGQASRIALTHRTDDTSTCTQSKDDHATQSTVTTDASLLTDIHAMPVKAQSGNGTAAKPSNTATESAPSAKSGTRPLRSDLGGAHPSVVLSDKPIQAHDESGKHLGHLNAKFHKWGDDTTLAQDVDDHDPIDFASTQHGVSKRTSHDADHAPIDRGADGCIGGSDAAVTGKPVVPRSVSITGMDNHQLCDIPIVAVGGLAASGNGPVVCAFQEVAHTGKHQSIISAMQLEHYGMQADDRHPLLGGTDRITTPDGFIFPLSFNNGLPHLPMRPFTARECDALPHVIMTSDQIWDPRQFSNDPSFDVHSSSPVLRNRLPHKDCDLRGEHICASLHSQETLELEKFTNGEAFEDAHEHPPDSVTEPFHFWLDDHTHQHHERTARCMHAFPTVTRSQSKLDAKNGKALKSGTSPRAHTPSQRDCERLKRFFAWIPTELIEATFRDSTQHGCMPASPDGNLFARWHSPNPALNVHRLNDDLLTDEMHSNAKALDSGHAAAQIFFGRKSHVVHVEPVSRARTFLITLQNSVRRWGAPNRLLGDHAGSQQSFQVLDCLRMLWIGFWCSEACCQHQNMFERRHQTFKRTVNRLMDRTGSPPELWFLCLCHVAYVFNRISDPSLQNRQPCFMAAGSVADVSALLSFSWMEPVCFEVHDSSFPSDSPEALGHWVGVSEHVGHAMTYNIWCRDANEVVDRSDVRSAVDPSSQNHRSGPIPSAAHNTWLISQLSPSASLPIPAIHQPSTPQDYGERVPGRPPDHMHTQGEDASSLSSPSCGEPQCLKEHNTDEDAQDTHNHTTPPGAVLTESDGCPKTRSDGTPVTIPDGSEHQLKGMSFLKREDDGTRRRATALHELKSKGKGNKKFDEFAIRHDQEQIEDIMTHNDIMNHLHRDQSEDDGIPWKFRRILSHQGPLQPGDRHHKQSKCNIEIEWENGEIAYEPVAVFKEDDPVTLAAHARDNDPLDTPGWRSLKRFAKRTKKLERLVKQAKLRSFRTAPRCKCGFRVPRTHAEAKELDMINDCTKWTDAVNLEMQQLDDCNAFIDRGIYSINRIPPGFKRITVHLAFDAKHDGRHKARMVAGGHLTDAPLSSVHAGVVSLRGLRICIFLAELNGMEAHATDIGNACLEARTQEKVCMKAGPEFGAHRDGHLLIMHKALHGLRSSGKEFGDLLASCLRELGFAPSKAEPEIFMKERGGICECVATCVDDLCLVMKDPEAFLEVLQSKPCNFKPKGSGPLSFHLGCGFRRDGDDELVMDPVKCIDEMMAACKQLFNTTPSTKPRSPLEENCHPELDTSEFSNDDDTQKFQSMIGSLQWLVSIGRWDIMTPVMSLSSFRAQPRKGHMEQAKRMCGCVQKTKHHTLKFRVDQPEVSQFDNKMELDWSKSVCGEDGEELPTDGPKPLGNKVTLSHCFDANLMHDVTSGKAVTGCLHSANKTPMMWHSRKQATTETATCGAEFVAARTCIEHTIDLRNTFRHLGVPAHPISCMFGDNETVVNGASFPHARLHKRHDILSFHCARSQIARGHIALHHIRSHDNAADIVSKHWSCNAVKHLIKPFFCASGNAAHLCTDDSKDCLDELFTPSGHQRMLPQD